MSKVLIRDVPPDDLEQIRAAAAERGTSLQHYLLEAVHAQAAYLRRQDALSAAARRLQDRPEVADDERDAVLEAIDVAHEERAARLGDRSSR
jgi:uncharacterized protein (DUF1778 family)